MGTTTTTGNNCEIVATIFEGQTYELILASTTAVVVFVVVAVAVAVVVCCRLSCLCCVASSYRAHSTSICTRTSTVHSRYIKIETVLAGAAVRRYLAEVCEVLCDCSCQICFCTRHKHAVVINLAHGSYTMPHDNSLGPFYPRVLPFLWAKQALVTCWKDRTEFFARPRLPTDALLMRTHRMVGWLHTSYVPFVVSDLVDAVAFTSSMSSTVFVDFVDIWPTSLSFRLCPRYSEFVHLEILVNVVNFIAASPLLPLSHCRDARVDGDTTTAMHAMSTHILPFAPPCPLRVLFGCEGLWSHDYGHT